MIFFIYRELNLIFLVVLLLSSYYSGLFGQSLQYVQVCMYFPEIWMENESSCWGVCSELFLTNHSFKTGGMVIVWDKDLPHFLTKLTFNLTLNKITLTFSTEIYCSCSFRKEGDAFLAREPLVPLWMQVPLPHPSVLDLWGLTTCHRFLPHPSSAQHGQDIILLSRV